MKSATSIDVMLLKVVRRRSGHEDGTLEAELDNAEGPLLMGVSLHTSDLRLAMHWVK